MDPRERFFLIAGFAFVAVVLFLVLPYVVPATKGGFWQFFAFISTHTDTTIVVSILVAFSIALALWVVFVVVATILSYILN